MVIKPKPPNPPNNGNNMTYEIYILANHINDSAYYGIDATGIADALEALSEYEDENTMGEEYAPVVEIRKFDKEEMIEAYGDCDAAMNFEDLPKYVQKKVASLITA